MVTSRFIADEDRELLQAALERDTFHPGRSVDIFAEPDTITSLYFDEQGPVLAVRAYKSLFIDLLCLNNADPRNKRVLQEGWVQLCKQAKEAGYREIVTSVSGPALLKFCLKPQSEGGLGYEQVGVQPNGDALLRHQL